MARLFLLWLVAATSVARAEPMLSVKAEAVWNGMVKPGDTTEIAVTLLAERNDQAEIILPDHTPRLRVTTSLDAFRPRTLWLTVRPEAGKPLRVDAQLGGGVATATYVAFKAAPADANMMASTLSLGAASSPAIAAHKMRSTLLTSSVTMLPHTPGGYGSIDSVILDGASLAALDGRQLASLRDYATQCGPIVVVGMATSRYADLSADAGCGSRFISRVRDGETALRVASGMRTDGKSPTPSANRLRTMLGSEMFSTTWTTLALFFVIYAVGLILVARSARKWMPLLLVPLISACLGWSAWSNDKVDRRLISWSEIDPQDHTLRYAALLQITGDGKGEASTPLPRDLGLFQMQPADGVAELDRVEPDAKRVVLRTHSRLLSQQTFFTEGTMRIEPTITVTLTDRGPMVENRGTAASPPALLGWDDQRHPVPALRPGERWYPPAHGTPWNVARLEEQMLRRHSQDGMAAVLLPHKLLPAGSGTPDIKENGWLLIVNS